MELFIFFLVIYILEALIAWEYYTHLFFSDKNALPALPGMLALYAVPFIVSQAEIIWLNTLLFILANFIAGLWLCRLKWHISLFHACFIAIIMTLCDYMVVGLNTSVMTSLYINHVSTPHVILSAAFSKLFYFLILQIILHFFKRPGQSAPFQWRTLLLIAIPLLSVFIFWTFSAIWLTCTLPTRVSSMISVSSIIILIINILVFWLYDQNQRHAIENTRLQIQFQKEYDLISYYSLLLKQDKAHRILIHDINKHLQTIADLNSWGEQDRIASYIEHLSHFSGLASPVRLCDNEQLNAVLSRYLQICQERYIKFHIDIRSGLLSDFPYEDIAALFCNLLDNSLEAASGIPNSYIELSVTRPHDDSPIVLALFNTCRDDPFDPVTGKLVSHKKSKGFHGIGVKSIERVVEKHNGNMTMYYKKERREFHTVISF